MLRCPICETELNDTRLQSDRCPACGSVLAWPDDDPEPMPPRRRRGDDIAEASRQAESGETPSEEYPPSPPPAAVQVSQTLPVIPPQQVAAPPPSTPPAARETDGPKRTLVDIFTEGGSNFPVTRSGSPRDHGAVENVRSTQAIRPRELSPDASQSLESTWKRTISPTSRPNMTIKTDDAGSTDLSTQKTAPRRRVRDLHEPNSAAADYQILNVIGEGGVGVVYAARQTSVDRTVAVKMLRPDVTAEWEQQQKFLSEAVVTGDLDHPNIVPIYDLGSGDDGALFYSMKRVVGTPWSDVLTAKSNEENLGILMKVADAIAFAHSRGVVHRDLKPENVMLGDFGEVLVMDWGIALPTPKFQRVSSILQSGSLGGTPAYMAPEMATGPVSKIGTASDVYLLGGILFEMITGLTPHHGNDVMECLQAAARNEIPPTNKSGELLNIALRALATDPEDRYESVQNFQNAIRDYQSHTESIALSSRAEDDLQQADRTKDYQDFARSLFAFEEAFALWDGNHRAAMGISAAKLAYAQCAFEKTDFDLGLSLLGESEPTHHRLRGKLLAAQKERDARQQRLKSLKRTAVMLVGILFVVISFAFVQVQIAKNDALEKKDQADLAAADLLKKKNELDQTVQKLDIQTTAANKAAQEASDSANLANREKDKAQAATDRAMVSKWREEILKLRTEYDKYLARIALAAEKINRNEFDEARRILQEYEKSDLSHWEWARLWFLCGLSTRDFNCKTPVETVAFSPDGKRFVSGGQDGIVRVWKTSLQVGEQGDLQFERLHRKQTPINAVAWSPDGRWIVSAGDDGRVRLWNAADGSPVTAFTTGGHTDAVTSAAFSYSDKHKWLVTSSRDKSVIVWDVERKLPAHPPLRGHSWWVWDVDVSLDQKRIVTAGQDGKIILWKVADTIAGLQIRIEEKTLSAQEATKDQRQLPLVLDGYHNGPVYTVAFSPDGKRVVSGGFDNRVLVWNPDDVHPVNLRLRLEGKTEPAPDGLQLIGHTLPVRSVQFSPDRDGRLILSCSDDNTVIVWNAETGKLERTLRGHGSWVRACAFAPGGMQLDAVSPNDRLVISGGYDHKVKLWRIAGYEEVRVYRSRVLGAKQRDEEDEVLAAVFDPLGQHVAVAGKARGVRVWNVASQKLIVIDDDSRRDYREGHEFLASSILFFQRPPLRGRRFVSAAMDGTVRVWDVDAGAEIMRLAGTGSMGAFALSPDERMLATGSDDNAVLLWPLSTDGTSPSNALRLRGHDADVTALAFSPDGSTLITGDTTGQCLVWDLATRKLTGLLNRNAGGRRHTKQITRIAFLDDNRVVTSSNDNTVVVWNRKQATEIGRMIHDDSVIAMDVSPDRRRILTACRAATRVSTASDGEGDFLLQVFDPTGTNIAKTRISRTSVSSARFSPDGNRVLAVGNDGRLQEWSPADNRIERLWPKITADRDMWAATYSPNGKYILTVGGRRVRLRDRTTGDTLMTFGSHTEITRLAFSDDGRRLASGDSTGSVKLWNLPLGRSEQTLSRIHEGPIAAVLFPPGNSLRLITVGGRTIRLWQYDVAKKQWKPESDLPPTSGAVLTDAALSPDRKWLVTGAADGTLQMWNFAERKSVEPFQSVFGHTAAVRTVAFSQDGEWIVSGGDDKSAIIWQRNALHQRWVAIAQLKGHPAPVNGVSISRDRYRVLTGSDDKTAKIWDTRTLVPGAVASVSSGRVEAIQRLSDDLRMLEDTLTRWTQSKTELPVDKIVRDRVAAVLGRIHDQVRSHVDVKLINNPQTKPILQLVQTLRKRIDPEETRPVVNSGQENDVRRQDLLEAWKTPEHWTALADLVGELKRLTAGPATVTEILTLTGHVRGVTAVTFSPNGRTVLTGSRDGKSVLWPAVNIAPAIRLPAGPLVCDATNRQTRIAPHALVFDPDSAVFDGGTLTVTLSNEDAGRGRVSLPTQDDRTSRIKQKGTSVLFRSATAKPWAEIGQASTDASGQRLTVTFNTQSSGEAVSACLRNIEYTGQSLAGRRVTAGIELNDGDGGAARKQTQLLIFSSPADEQPLKKSVDLNE